MTKSTITDERITSVIERPEHYACNLKWTNVRGAQDLLTAADGLRELQERRKADSEPIGYFGRFDPDDEDLIDQCSKNVNGAFPLYRHAQPAPEYPETLPCPVLLEPGLRFGKGIKTSSVLAALARRAVYESDMAALSQEERAEFQARIEDFKALIAQPVPVVPQDVLEALQKVARIRLDLNDFVGDRRGIADCLGDAEEALIEVVNRRASMLNGGKP